MAGSAVKQRPDPDVERYRAEKGKDPPEPGDHPLGWQWDYRGTPEDRERLAEELLPPEPQPPEQESLL